ncbi:hypothetical protein AAC387_Pa01g3260 [Persea americana]
MSERNSWRRTPTHGRKTLPPHPNYRPLNLPSFPRLNPTKPIKILQRCSSEPIIPTVGSFQEDDHRRQNQVLTASLQSISPSPYSSQRYREDAKVVVNVMVEGSPGPVRAMVSLGASIEDTIKLVVDKYGQERRSPRLDRHALSTFELHDSYFSLQGLNKWNRVGDVGSRSFFLRKSCSSSSDRNMLEEEGGRRGRSEIVDSGVPVVPPQLFYSFIAPRISKIRRRTRRIWKVLGCMACS